jgi:hypothetical protein
MWGVSHSTGEPLRAEAKTRTRVGEADFSFWHFCGYVVLVGSVELDWARQVEVFVDVFGQKILKVGLGPLLVLRKGTPACDSQIRCLAN